MPKLAIYLLGLIPVAIGQYWLRSELGNSIAFGIVIAYLIALRFVAEKWSKDRKVGQHER